MTDEAGRRSFWTSLAGVITALGTFIAAVGAILGLLAANHVWPFPPEREPADTGVIAATPSNQSFGSVQLGQASAARAVTITNHRRTAVTMSVAMRDDGSGSFEIALDTCSTAPLVSNGACQLELLFSPKQVGQRVARVVLSMPGGEVATQVALAGVGLPAGALSFTPTSVYLGLFTTSQPAPPSASRIVTIVNTGGGQVTINNVTVGDSHFAVTVGCHGSSLPPGGSCSLVVTFSASANGTYKTTLSVNDNAPGSPHEIALTGYRGPLIVIPIPRLSLPPGTAAITR